MINDYGAYIKEKRRFFHAIPEIAYNEFKTQKHIIEELESLGVDMAEIRRFGKVEMCDGSDPDGRRFQISSRGT